MDWKKTLDVSLLASFLKALLTWKWKITMLISSNA